MGHLSPVLRKERKQGPGVGLLGTEREAPDPRSKRRATAAVPPTPATHSASNDSEDSVLRGPFQLQYHAIQGGMHTDGSKGA